MRNKVLAIACLVIAAILGGYMLNDALNQQPSNPAYNSAIATTNSIVKPPAANPKTVLITGLEQSSKLITSEMDLICDIAMDDTWLDLGVFSKEQIFSFEGRAAYTADLAALSEDSIEADMENKTLTIHIDEPSVYNIYIDPESIQTKEIRNGLLRFGEVSLKEEDIKALLIAAEEQMHSVAGSPENIQRAKENTAESIIKLFIEILKNADASGYKIIISYN